MRITRLRIILLRFFLIAVLIPLVWRVSSQETSGLSPARLRCEFSSNPTGIDVSNPRLFWIVEGNQRGQKQTAYQILVSSSESQVAQDKGDLWDTGKVTSDATIHISYAGRKLVPSQQAFWKVRVWDKDGKASAWSSAASWTMGLLAPPEAADRDAAPAGWQARWICAQATSESLLLRKEFEVKPGLKRALIHVSGLGQYEMNLNGAKAGDDLLAPGWTDYNDTVLYDTKDVTGLLKEGRNAIGLTLGNGMYHVVRRNRFAKFTGSFGPLRAICQVQLEYKDGSTEVVGTDDSWLTYPGGITYSSIYGGEDFDARLYPAGWDKPDFDDSAWKKAVLVVRPPGTLRGHSVASEPLRVIETREPVSKKPISDHVVVYDFGQNASYMPRLRVTGPKGSTVRLTPAEIVKADGSIERSTMGSAARGLSWWEYTKATDGEETWFPQFYYVGCRYLEARTGEAVAQTFQSAGSGDFPVASQTNTTTSALESASNVQAGKPALQIKSLEGVIVHSSAAPTGEFECSNDLLNRIRTLVRWSQRANMVSVLTDCPHREKLGWLEQYHLNGPAIRYEFDMARMFTKGMNDMADSQLANGLVPNIAPEYTEFQGAFRGAAEWGAAFIVVPWQQYQFCGDLNLLRTHYGDMKRYFAYLESHATNNILSEGLGDWFDLGPKKPNAAQLTPPPVTATAFFHHDAHLLSQIAALLEKPDDAKAYARRAESIRASYNEKFFNKEKKNYATDSQCANALPLVLGIVEPENRPAVLASLLRDLESRNYAMTAGDVGFRFLLQALAEGGQSEAIYKMIIQDDKPGYAYILKKGETSMTESWDANNTTSHNHFMLGQITEWFYKDLAGIDCDPTGPGFKKIIINPHPVGDLKWVKTSYDSIHGKIRSEWKREEGQFTLKVTIPPNTTATVFIPAKLENAVTEGKMPLERRPGVKSFLRENDRVKLTIDAGEYEFQSR